MRQPFFNKQKRLHTASMERIHARFPAAGTWICAAEGDEGMPRKTVFEMSFDSVYSALVQKAERKGRTRAEVDEVTSWLTGYTPEQISAFSSDISYGAFLSDAPAYNPRAELITGKVCGIQVETIEDPLMKRVRQLDKLVDELARGKAMEKVLR